MMASEPNVATAQIRDEISALRTGRVAGYILPPAADYFWAERLYQHRCSRGELVMPRVLEINPEWLAGRRPRAASNMLCWRKHSSSRSTSRARLDGTNWTPLNHYIC